MPEVPIRPRTIPLGHATMLEIQGDEEGFELFIDTDEGRYVVNIHACAATLVEAVSDEIVPWIEEGGLARAERRHDDEQRDAYDLRNPKHPDWHSVHADLYDSRSGK